MGSVHPNDVRLGIILSQVPSNTLTKLELGWINSCQNRQRKKEKRDIILKLLLVTLQMGLFGIFFYYFLVAG